MMRFLFAILFALIPSLALAQPDWGVYPDGGTLYFYSNTVGTDGVAETPASEAIAVYKDGSATELTTGATIDDDFDSKVGFHQIAIDTTQSGFDAGSTYTVMYTAGTVDSVSIVGRVIGSFRLGTVDANITKFGGTAGTFSSGRPEVNTSHVAGTAQTAFDMAGRIQTALPNAAPAASGGLYTRGTGAGQINQAVNGTIDVNVTHFGNATGTFSSGRPEVNTTYVNGTVQTAGDLAALSTAIKTKTDFLPSATAGASGGVVIAGSNAATTFATLTSTGAFTINGTSNVAQTGDSYARIGANGASLSAVPWNASWDAEVQSEVDDALRAIHLHYIFETAYNPASKPGSASGLLNVMVENDGGVPRFTVNALEQGPSGGGGGGGLDAQEVRDAMMLAPSVGTPAAGSIDANLDKIYGGIR